MSILNKIFKKEKEVKEKDSKKTSQKVAKTEPTQKKTTPKKQAVKADKVKKLEPKKNFPAYKVLVKPVITEKATDLTQYNKYVFEVEKKATKNEIKKAIAGRYDVQVNKVNIVNVKGKNVRYGRNRGKTRSWKKAVVTLKSGDKIEL